MQSDTEPWNNWGGKGPQEDNWIQPTGLMLGQVVQEQSQIKKAIISLCKTRFCEMILIYPIQVVMNFYVKRLHALVARAWRLTGEDNMCAKDCATEL